MNEALLCRNLCVHVFIHQAIVTAVLHRAVQRRVTMEYGLASPYVVCETHLPGSQKLNGCSEPA